MEAIGLDIAGHIATTADVVNHHKLVGLKVKFLECSLQGRPDTKITTAGAPSRKDFSIKIDHGSTGSPL